MATKQWLGTTSAVWDTAANWSPVNEPSATGDSAYFNQLSTGTGGVAGSDQSGILLDLLSIPSTFIYDFGTNGTPLKVLATIANIGEPSQSSTQGAGSGRINLDTGDDPSTITVFSTKQSSTDTGKAPVRIKCNDVLTTINVLAGRVGIATDAIGDTATLGTLNVTGTGANVTAAAGMTVTNAYQTAGTLTLNSAPATLLRVDGGVCNVYGDYTGAALTIRGATVYDYHRKVSAGNEWTAVNLYDGSCLDISSLSAAVAIGTITVYGNAKIKRNKANPSHLTWTTLTFAGGNLSFE